LKIHDYFDRTSSLSQGSGTDRRVVVFMVDRDNDDFLGVPLPSPHVVRTQSADVEAEILANGKVMRAIATAHGLGRHELKRLQRVTKHPGNHLANEWRDWIELRLLAKLCRREGRAPLAAPSQINAGQFGPVQVGRASATRASILSATPSPVDVRQLEVRTRSWVDGAFVKGTQHELLSGKWIVQFVLYLVRRELRNETVKASVGADQVVVACLETVRYKPDLVKYYDDALSRLFPSVSGVSVPTF
jgi:hypothetical protein